MENQTLKMSLEEYLRGKLNVPSDRGAPFGYDGLAKEVGARNIQNFVAKTRKILGIINKQMDSSGVNLEPNVEENFSISPMPFGRSPGYEGIVGLVREYYEAQGMIYDKKASTPSRDNPDPSIGFRAPDGRRFYVTYTPTFLNDKMMELLFTSSFQSF